MSLHIPVMVKEVVSYLALGQGARIIDCTIGCAGHTKAILEKIGPEGKLFGIDRSYQSIKLAREALADFNNRVIIKQANFVHLQEVAQENGFSLVDGILYDLGLASFQIKDPQLGLSFQLDAPLDMRLEPIGISAKEVINRFSESNLARIFKEFGEEPFAHKIAQEIIRARRKQPIETTGELATLVTQIKPKRGKLHPATLVFQALRIFVNQELENLKQSLPQAVELLKNKGRLVIISYHSLEDRIVKNFLREAHQLKILTKKPITANIQEISQNPSARSAKLRAAEKI